MRRAQLFVESATGGPSLETWQAKEWWILRLDPLHTGSLAGSASPLPPPRVDKALFSSATERLWQRLAPSNGTVENVTKPAKQLISTQTGAWMRDLHAGGPHPARKLGLCAAREGAKRHKRKPSCARRAGKGRVSRLGGRVGALTSCPCANLRAGLAEIPKPPRGQNAHVALWRAGLRAEEGARKPPALSQRSPRTVQRPSAPSRPLLNLPLRLRCWHRQSPRS